MLRIELDRMVRVPLHSPLILVHAYSLFTVAIGSVLVYGSGFDAAGAVTGLLAAGVSPSRVVLVSPAPTGTAFFGEAAVMAALAARGIETVEGFELRDWGVVKVGGGDESVASGEATLRHEATGEERSVPYVEPLRNLLLDLRVATILSRIPPRTDR